MEYSGFWILHTGIIILNCYFIKFNYLQTYTCPMPPLSMPMQWLIRPDISKIPRKS